MDTTLGELAPPQALYRVRWVNYYYSKGEPGREVNFMAGTPDDVRYLVGALSGYCSGDHYEVYINGEKAVLELDWGLA